MSKRKEKDLYEDCLREFIRSFHASQLKERKSFAKALAKQNSSYAKGYAYGLNDAMRQLKEIAENSNVDLNGLGFESVDLTQIQSAVDELQLGAE